MTVAKTSELTRYMLGFFLNTTHKNSQFLPNVLITWPHDMT